MGSVPAGARSRVFWFLLALATSGVRTGNSLAASTVGGAFVGLSLALFVLAALCIWSGIAMGRLSVGVRTTGKVVAWVGLFAGSVSATVGGSGGCVDPSTGATVTSSPIG